MYVIDASVHVADARPSEPHHLEAHALLARVAAEGWTVYLPSSSWPKLQPRSLAVRDNRGWPVA